jgi:hypothetical protein
MKACLEKLCRTRSSWVVTYPLFDSGHWHMIDSRFFSTFPVERHFGAWLKPSPLSQLMKRKLCRISDIVRSNFCRCVRASIFRGGSEMLGFVPVSLTRSSKHLCFVKCTV